MARESWRRVESFSSPRARMRRAWSGLSADGTPAGRCARGLGAATYRQESCFHISMSLSSTPTICPPWSRARDAACPVLPTGGIGRECVAPDIKAPVVGLRNLRELHGDPNRRRPRFPGRKEHWFPRWREYCECQSTPLGLSVECVRSSMAASALEMSGWAGSGSTGFGYHGKACCAVQTIGVNGRQGSKVMMREIMFCSPHSKVVLFLDCVPLDLRPRRISNYEYYSNSAESNLKGSASQNVKLKLRPERGGCHAHLPRMRK